MVFLLFMIVILAAHHPSLAGQETKGHSQESDPGPIQNDWRDQSCGYWIPSATQIPNGFVLVTEWGPPLTEEVFDQQLKDEEIGCCFSIRLKLLVAGGPPDATEVNLINEKLIEFAPGILMGEWLDKLDPHTGSEGCRLTRDNAQNVRLIDNVLASVHSEYPDSRVFDLFLYKEWFYFQWY
ncbi:MAG: hypothetical protein KC940_23950 [Candidatus Omnitrophica bacterium]|nr:hypothetical protein [Candidatus Omnitrophota bacterium]